MRIRTHLVLLILVALVPVLLFSAGVIALEVRHDRQAVERGLLDTARALAQAVDRQVADTITTLQALAVSPSLAADDLARFHAYAVRVVPTQSAWRTIFVADAAGRQVVNTSTPVGTGLASVADLPFFREVLTTRGPVVSDHHVGRTTGRHTVIIAVPVTKDGVIRYVLGAGIDLSDLATVFARQRIPDQWTGAILDRSKAIISRSRAAEQYLGQRATPELAEGSAAASEGTFWGPTKDGVASFGVFSRSALSGWTVVLGIPTADVLAGSRRTLSLLIVSGGAFVALGIGLALLFARRIERPAAQLARATRALEAGEVFQRPARAAVTELDHLADAMTQATRARQQAEDSLRVTLMSIGDGVIATDREGRVTLMNSTAEHLTGWTEAEAQRRPLDDVLVIVNEDTGRPAESPVSAVLRLGGIVGLANHTALIARDGTRRPIDDSGAPILDAAGQVTGVVLVFHDVSERRRAEAQREESEARFRVLADTAPVMIWMAEPDGRCTFFNKGWLDFTGRTMEQEAADGWMHAVHADDRARAEQTYRRALAARETFSMEYRLRRADGHHRWILHEGVPLVAADGTVTGWVGACIDIHERKLAEQDRARRLEEATEAREEAERTTDVVRQLQRVTDAALVPLPFEDLLRELLGRVREIAGADTAAVLLLDEASGALVTRACSGLDVSLEADARIPVGAGFAGRVAAERRAIIVDDMAEVPVVNPRLREVGLRSLLGVPLGADGRVIGVLHVGRRTPRRFTADDANLLGLVADRVSLAIEHARLYDAERSARAQAEQASRAKDEFLATLSHELRTPLTAVLGWARMLRRGKLDAAQSARALEVIERNAAAQSQLINDLLDMSRVVTGRLNLDIEPVDLVAVLEAALDAVRPAAEAKAITLELDSAGAPAGIAGDAARLQQVFWNLVSNAVKFTPRGGRVHVTVSCERSAAVVVVRDTGPGIAPDVLPLVFERFRQADSSTTRVHGGLGLGLAIVRHVVELHGGTVAADSPPGEGAVFTVRLPIPAAAPRAVEARAVARAAGERTAGPPGPSLRDVRVLIVDDEADARDLLAAILKSQDAQVAVAGSAAEALQTLDAFGPHVLVSDIGMPDLDGVGLIQAIRMRPASRGGRVGALALTAYAHPRDRERALAAGFDRYASKPIDPGELTRLVGEMARGM